MSGDEIVGMETDERGNEIHPAFGMARVNRVTSTGTPLFDSDILHSSFIRLQFSTATRRRELSRDWIHADRVIADVEMSEAQWAALVSSINTEGVPVTIRRTETNWQIPSPPFEPRLEVSQAEVRSAADKAFAAIKEARDVYEAKKTAANLRALHFAIENAAANVSFAAKSMTEHAENVVQKARVDIETMVISKARQLGLTDEEALQLTPAAADDTYHAEIEGRDS